MIRPRYVNRLTRDDVGRRVSIRRWVHADPDDPSGTDRSPSDIVGRLVGWSDDDVLTVVDRAGAPTRVPVADIVASRTVPEHPRLPPEPHEPRPGA